MENICFNKPVDSDLFPLYASLGIMWSCCVVGVGVGVGVNPPF